jgi:hypothetical protein
VDCNANSRADHHHRQLEICGWIVAVVAVEADASHALNTIVKSLWDMSMTGSSL